MKAGPVLFLSLFFPGRNKAKGALKLLRGGIPHRLQAVRGRGLSPPASGSHYVPAPSSGIWPGKKHPGKEKVQKSQFSPVSSKLGMGGFKEVLRFRLPLAQSHYETLENPTLTSSSAERRQPAAGTRHNEGKTTCIYLFLKFWHVLEGWEQFPCRG